MSRLSFWHKLVFIANICWLFSWAMKFYTFLPDGALRSNILITGMIIAYIANVMVHVWMGILFLRGKTLARVPLWLKLTNFIFLIVQLILLFK